MCSAGYFFVYFPPTSGNVVKNMSPLLVRADLPTMPSQQVASEVSHLYVYPGSPSVCSPDHFRLFLYRPVIMTARLLPGGMFVGKGGSVPAAARGGARRRVVGLAVVATVYLPHC